VLTLFGPSCGHLVEVRDLLLVRVASCGRLAHRVTLQFVESTGHTLDLRWKFEAATQHDFVGVALGGRRVGVSVVYLDEVLVLACVEA
jgi:hypothetical protein